MLPLPLVVFSLAILTFAKRHHPFDLRARASANGTSAATPIASAWYAGWHATDFPLSVVSWSKYTHMTYAFAVTTQDPGVVALDTSDDLLLPQFVSLAHQNGVKASLSIGGWTGSQYFSTAVGSARNRTTFVNTITNVAKKYTLDGIDFDWEYPGKQGIGCNLVSPNDTSNFLLFLRQLRNTTTGRSLVLSAAVYITPFTDASGSPSTNVSGFADVLDYIAIMNYDLKSNASFGAGPSSPLDDSCAPAGARFGSAVSSVAAWSGAGIPTSKLVLGVAAYGHSYIIPPSAALAKSNASSLNLYPPYNPSNTRHGDKWDGDGGIDICGATQGPGGIYTYWGLIEEGFLEPNGSAGDNIVTQYDDCSETPFAYNPNSQVYVSYENTRSFGAKGDFIHTNKLAGFAIWEAGDDSQDELLDSIKNATVNGNPSARSPKAAPQTVTGTQSSGSKPGLESSASTRVFVLSHSTLALLFQCFFVGLISIPFS